MQANLATAMNSTKTSQVYGKTFMTGSTISIGQLLRVMVRNSKYVLLPTSPNHLGRAPGSLREAAEIEGVHSGCMRIGFVIEIRRSSGMKPLRDSGILRVLGLCD